MVAWNKLEISICFFFPFFSLIQIRCNFVIYIISWRKNHYLKNWINKQMNGEFLNNCDIICVRTAVTEVNLIE